MITVENILNYLTEKKIEYEEYGNKSKVITGFSSLNNYKNDTITWCKDIKYVPEEKRDYAVVIVGKDSRLDEYFPNRITTENPKKIFFEIIEEFFNTNTILPEVGNNTYISDNVILGKNVKIGHNCTLAGNIFIGDNTVIYNNVSIINNVKIGNDCVIHSGVIMGHDDFAYTEDNEGCKAMIKHYGGIYIGNNVFIGAGTIINRGTIDDTIIKSGTKIDALCHISHNCIIDENCAFVSGTRLYGSAQIGKNVYIASATIKNQLKVGDNTIIGMGSIVLNDIEDNVTVAGVPAKIIKYNK